MKNKTKIDTKFNKSPHKIFSFLIIQKHSKRKKEKKKRKRPFKRVNGSICLSFKLSNNIYPSLTHYTERASSKALPFCYLFPERDIETAQFPTHYIARFSAKNLKLSHYTKPKIPKRKKIKKILSSRDWGSFSILEAPPKMCCGGRICMLCTCLILVVILIGLLFGFGVFKDGFHKLKDTVNYCDPTAHGSLCGRPFLGFAAPPPF